MMTDPISDMLTRVRNALAAKKHDLIIPASKIKYSIAKILQKEGYVGAVVETTEGKRAVLRVTLKYEDSRPIIRSLRRISTPGRRVYVKSGELPRVMSNLGIAIISTPNGLMTNKEARARRLGGEIICEIF